jgi:CarD family transcriptional regulator
MNYVFSIGDKVVYPMYGAGTITGMEEKVLDGEVRLYYVLNIPIGNLRMLVPAQKVEQAGIRSVIESDQLMKKLERVNDAPAVINADWSERYKENIEKIKSGNIGQVAEVFKNLRIREREKGLSSAEKKVLSTAKQIIISEIILSHEIGRTQAETLLDNAIC